MATFNGLQAPDSIAAGLNISYTVPAGKLAKLKVILSATNAGYISMSVTSANMGNGGVAAGSANNSVFEAVLPAGTIVSSVRTTNAGTTGTTNPWAARAAVATTTLTINGSNACTIAAQAAASNCSSGSAGSPYNTNALTAGQCDMGFIAEEYFG